MLFELSIVEAFPWNNFVGVDGTLLLTGTVDDDEEFVDDGEEITGTDLSSFCDLCLFLSSSDFSLEWFKLRLGLGEGELEFVEVGVLDNASMLISSFGGEDASICAPKSSRSKSS